MSCHSLPRALPSPHPGTYRWILWYRLVMPWCVQSFPSWGRMWPRASDLESRGGVTPRQPHVALIPCMGLNEARPPAPGQYTGRPSVPVRPTPKQGEVSFQAFSPLLLANQASLGDGAIDV